MGFAPANFQLAMPFRFYLASNTGHRQTDGQRSSLHNVPICNPCGRGRNNRIKQHANDATAQRYFVRDSGNNLVITTVSYYTARNIANLH